MALTDAQKADVRRFAGYPLAGNLESLRPPAYLSLGYVVAQLEERLASMAFEEEIILTDVFLANLTTLEAQIPLMAENLDTRKAGPWESNPKEQQQRERLFDGWRLRMCSFIGIAPGPGLHVGNSVALVRG